MSMNHPLSDNCHDVQVLYDVSQHFQREIPKVPEIICDSLSDVDCLSHVLPDSYSLNTLYFHSSGRTSPKARPRNILLGSSFYSDNYSPVTKLSITSFPNSVINLSTLPFSETLLAPDMLSYAPHFPSAVRSQNGNTNAVVNGDYINLQENLDCDSANSGQKIAPTCDEENLVENYDQFWKDLQNRWKTLARNEMESHPWLVHQSESDLEKAYHFSMTKEVMDGDLMKKGISLLCRGQLSLAICHFESELKLRPENSQAWLYLGSSLAENEQDELSISALKRCVSLDPVNFDARLLLAVGFTNESQYMQACRTLHEWFIYHPTFSSLNQSESIEILDSPFLPSFLDNIYHQKVVELFNKAIYSSVGDPHEIGDLHVALGILFHLAERFTDSVGHFKQALVLQPDNPMLWNKLGATLANGQRNEEAIQAYKEALRLYPNYVRCRYNLGIACMNMKSFPEACGHFLMALKLQSTGKGPASTPWNLWSTLRLAMMLGDMPKLLSYVDNRDIDSLINEFDVSV